MGKWKILEENYRSQWNLWWCRKTILVVGPLKPKFWESRVQNSKKKKKRYLITTEKETKAQEESESQRWNWREGLVSMEENKHSCLRKLERLN